MEHSHRRRLGARKHLKSLAERTGLEPATPGVTGRYSNQLNYRSGWGGESYLIGECAFKLFRRQCTPWPRNGAAIAKSSAFSDLAARGASSVSSGPGLAANPEPALL